MSPAERRFSQPAPTGPVHLGFHYSGLLRWREWGLGFLLALQGSNTIPLPFLMLRLLVFQIEIGWLPPRTR